MGGPLRSPKNTLRQVSSLILSLLRRRIPHRRSSGRRRRSSQRRFEHSRDAHIRRVRYVACQRDRCQLTFALFTLHFSLWSLQVYAIYYGRPKVVNHFFRSLVCQVKSSSVPLCAPSVLLMNVGICPKSMKFQIDSVF